MAKISFYFDENIQTALADALKTRGIDVLTTHQAGNAGVEDNRQLAYARFCLLLTVYCLPYFVLASSLSAFSL